VGQGQGQREGGKSERREQGGISKEGELFTVNVYIHISYPDILVTGPLQLVTMEIKHYCHFSLIGHLANIAVICQTISTLTFLSLVKPYYRQNST
jgi:hypothetical protein